MTLSPWESRARGEERAQHFAQNFRNSQQKRPSPAATASDPPASGRVKWMRRWNPHDYAE